MRYLHHNNLNIYLEKNITVSKAVNLSPMLIDMSPREEVKLVTILARKSKLPDDLSVFVLS